MAAAGTRLIERIERIGAIPDDPRTLRVHLLEELRRAVDFDAYAWVLTDPETAVGSAPLADVPCLPELPRLIRLRYLSTVRRWPAPPAPPGALLGGGAAGDPWADFLASYGVVDVATVVFRDGFGCW